jgi:hypothetical protein
MKKIGFTKNPAPANRIDSVFCPRHASERNSESLLLFFPTERNSKSISLPRNCLERNSESLLLFLFHSTEFLAFFSSAE